jgi:hypothetical protein
VSDRPQIHIQITDQVVHVEAANDEPLNLVIEKEGDTLVEVGHGGIQGPSGPDGADGIAIVAHGDDPEVERPDGVAVVIWRGTVKPAYWTDADIWVDTTI